VKYLGYKSAIIRSKYLYSIYDRKFKISQAKVGSVVLLDKFYLGTSKQFVLDYYSDITDEDEVLLTYEYDESDIVSGGPPNHPLSEIIVKRAKLIKIDPMIKDEYPWIPLDLVLAFETVAADLGVSQVARGPKGFLKVYKEGRIDSYWRNRRQNFIKRHMAFVEKNNESLWKNGYPTRRHLALIMWAYTPDLERVKNSVNLRSKYKKKNPLNKGFELFNGFYIPKWSVFLRNAKKASYDFGDHSEYVIDPVEGFVMEYQSDDKTTDIIKLAIEYLNKNGINEVTFVDEESSTIFTVPNVRQYYELIKAFIVINTEESIDLASEFLHDIDFELYE
jgi:hypothetical protein